MEGFLKLDCHVHSIGRQGQTITRYGGDTFATPRQLREKYDAWGIEKGVLLPEVICDGAFAVQSNEEALELAQQNPDTLIFFCNLDPRMGDNSPDTDFTHFMQYYKARGAKGIGELTANLPMRDPLVVNLMRHAAANTLPVTIHIAPRRYGCYGLVDELGLPGLEWLLHQIPDLVILGHSQPFWAEISADITQEHRNDYPQGKVKPGRLAELLRTCPHLYGDLSAGSGFNALKRDPDYAYRFLEEFQDKLLFGTDICAPFNYMGLSFWLDEALEAGHISERAYRKICRENLEKLLKL